LHEKSTWIEAPFEGTMMSEGEKKPWEAKSRLPFEPSLAPGAASSGARAIVLVIYVVAFLGMAGAAAFMMLARGAAFSSPQVLIPSVGAIWFFVRILMVARPKKVGP
jgi:hypothetical protein